MYKVISEGQIVQICDKVNYIRIKPETGCFVNTDKEHAEGIAISGTVYNLPNHVIVPDAPEAQAFEISDNGQYLFDGFKHSEKEDEKQVNKINDVEDAVCELDESAGSRLDSIEDALCELDELLNR